MWTPRRAGEPYRIDVPKRVDRLRIRPDGQQQAWIDSRARFNVVPAGRRSLKTEIAKRKTVKRALSIASDCPYADPRFFLAAPTRDQAKRIFWQDLKRMVPFALVVGRPIETELRINLITGVELHVLGMDQPARIEGVPWDGGVLDEYGNMKPTAWSENVYPALADRNGWCDLIGVPEGRNHYYDLYLKARAMMLELAEASEWAVFSWPSSDILPPEAIEAARRDLDELTFQQEYEASFVNFEGRAYYCFSETTHCAALVYNPRAPLVLCFDFNVSPGVCALIQEQVLPKQFEHASDGAAVPERPIVGTGVIGEVHIPRNSNTPAVCRRIIQDFGRVHEGKIKCYGDATGGAAGSAKVQGSDWDLIERELRPIFRERLSFNIKSTNPSERARVNAMNSRMKSSRGDIRFMVDLAKAPQTVRDLEGVQLLKGGSGEIDKKATPLITHLSDAIGYYVESEFPIEGAGLVKMKLSGV